MLSAIENSAKNRLSDCQKSYQHKKNSSAGNIELFLLYCFKLSSMRNRDLGWWQTDIEIDCGWNTPWCLQEAARTHCAISVANVSSFYGLCESEGSLCFTSLLASVRRSNYEWKTLIILDTVIRHKIKNPKRKLKLLLFNLKLRWCSQLILIKRWFLSREERRFGWGEGEEQVQTAAILFSAINGLKRERKRW